MVVGLGAVAQTHLKVLQDIPRVNVVAGVDPVAGKELSFRGLRRPVYKAISEAIGQQTPSLIIVTTPTPTHAMICDEARQAFPRAHVLVEKPAADNVDDAIQLLSDRDQHRPVDVAYHMAYSPEVLWAAEIAHNQAANFGPPTTIRAVFADPYADDVEDYGRRFGNSWIDSGINALSVISRFCDLDARCSLRTVDATTTFIGRFLCSSHNTTFTATVLTTWHVTDASRKTLVRFESGAELVMDHHAVAGLLTSPDGDIADIFSSNGSVPRRETHYRNLYNSYLVQNFRLMDSGESLHLHRLLLQTDMVSKGQPATRS